MFIYEVSTDTISTYFFRKHDLHDEMMKLNNGINDN